MWKKERERKSERAVSRYTELQEAQDTSVISLSATSSSHTGCQIKLIGSGLALYCIRSVVKPLVTLLCNVHLWVKLTDFSCCNAVVGSQLSVEVIDLTRDKMPVETEALRPWGLWLAYRLEHKGAKRYFQSFGVFKHRQKAEKGLFFKTKEKGCSFIKYWFIFVHLLNDQALEMETGPLSAHHGWSSFYFVELKKNEKNPLKWVR